MKNKKIKKIHVRVGEEVKIITGDDKGKFGLIKKILRSQNKIIVEGINIKFKHTKSNRAGQVGEIKRIEFPIHSSNVQSIRSK
ncbi:unnamed protein product [Dictyota dichotoma]